MTRQTSKGTCTFCHKEMSKSGMTRHLATCEQRVVAGEKPAGRAKSQITKTYHLVVEGRNLPMYWMHLEIPTGTTLATLDQFLRNIWLECCGHLSAFEIGGIHYSVDEARLDDGWGMRDKSMYVRLDKVLSPGEACSYEYDFGSTTELKLKVVAEREVEGKGQGIQIIARNSLPLISCNACGKPATSICSQCIYEDNGYLCDACADAHECGAEMLLPMVNSPRAGVCAYSG